MVHVRKMSDEQISYRPIHSLSLPANMSRSENPRTNTIKNKRQSIDQFLRGLSSGTTARSTWRQSVDVQQVGESGKDFPNRCVLSEEATKCGQ